MASNNTRSMALLREQGYEPEAVDHYNPYAARPGGGRGIAVDLYNFGDLIAMNPETVDILICQTTAYSCVSARKKKILAEPRALVWLKSGGSIVIHGWHKKPKRPGLKQLVWKCREVHITQEDFNT